MKPHGVFRPHSHPLALEPRILFDGAAAAATSDQHHATADKSATDAHPAATEPRENAAAPAPTAPRHLVVIDSRLENREALTAQLPVDTTAIVVDPGTDALNAISAALAQMAKTGQVDSIQIFSHGTSGQFTLGNRTYTAESLAGFADTLKSWQGAMRQDADILLFGCQVGAGEAGRALVSQLARLTDADVGASDDDTGSASAGGDWTLEVASGILDKPLALSDAAVRDYQGLMADASPTLSIGTATKDVVLGGTVTFDVTMTNPSSQVGYGPYVDLYLSASGRDGDDGVTFVSATYLGQAVTAFTVTFDAQGNAVHPLARDGSGNPIIINAASVGMRPGDQLVVLQLPFGSLSQGQPPVTMQVTARLSELADTSFSNGSPDLLIRARAGFELGNDSLNNPTDDPSLIGAALVDFTVHPTLLTITETLDMTEGETATGPNFVHHETVTITPATPQPLNTVRVTQVLPDDIQVTAITPGGNGVLVSITLQDGAVLTNPTAIAAAIAADNIFIASYTVEYATLTGPVQNVVSFYVPETNAAGTPIIDSSTGDAVNITFGDVTATGNWVPLDPRDLTPPATSIAFTASGDGAVASFTARAITLEKQATIAAGGDVGSAGPSPGDTLRYDLNLAISDYFAFGQNLLFNGSFTVVDTLGDGQTLTGTPTLVVTQNGITHTLALVTSTTVNADGTTTLTFDIAASLRQSPDFPIAALVGDFALNATQNGATTAVISYTALLGQRYSGTTRPQPEINEGDAIGNAATVTATLVQDPLNLTGFTESEQSASTTTIPVSHIDIEIVAVNGGTPPASGELRPGDTVTFTLSYDLVTGDYENFSLTTYLPLPLFDASGVAWSQGSGVNQWTLGAGNTNLGPITGVTTGPGNSVVFTFGDFATASVTGSRIEIQFTMRVGDQPFSDQRSLDVLAQSSQTTTLNQTVLSSSDVAVIISVAEPVLGIEHGVVSTSHGTVTGTTGTWAAPGSGGAPFTGSVTDLAALNGAVTGIDAGDVVRLATAVENTGGGGAFDVGVSITLPPGLSFLNGSLDAANLRIYRGNGVALVEGTDYTVNGNTITFLDAGAVATLLAGRTGGTAVTDGSNIVVITYDTVVANAIAASSTLQSTAALTHYASVDGGADFTTSDITNTADEQVAAPEVTKVVAGGSLDDGDSSATQTTGANLVVGESMLYDIVVTVPEGSTQSLRVDDLIPPGMQLDTSFNGGLGYELITTVAGSAALTANFNGNLTIDSVSGLGGTAGAAGVGARMTFSVAGATADNVVGNEKFVIRLRLVASNVPGNQAGTTHANQAQATFSDPDGNVPNGTAPVDRTVAQSGAAPTTTLVEPTLTITQSTSALPPLGVDAGDVVEFTVVITNGSGAGDVNAYDITFSDNVPGRLINLTLSQAVYAGGATANGGPDFILDGSQIRTADGANIDIPTGGSITLRFTGTVSPVIGGALNLANVAVVQWTSLDGTTGPAANPAGERTGTDGLLNGGTLNDYQSAATVIVPVSAGIQISRVGGLPDTAAPSPTTALNEDVAVGEVLRYRVVALVPEGVTENFSVQVTLQNGLEFLNDGTIRMTFVSAGGIVSTLTLISSGSLNVSGNENSPIALPITATLSGPAPDGVLLPTQILVSRDANGNTVVTFALGTLANADRDLDLEGVSIEFNARVANQAGNVRDTPLAVTAADFSGTTALSQSDTVIEIIAEPGFSGMNKQVVDFVPNPAGSTGTATVSVRFTGSGDMTAYDVALTDGFPGSANYALVSVTIDGVTYGQGNLPAGVSFSGTGGVTVNFASLASTSVVEVRYTVEVPNTATIAATNAELRWTSLPPGFSSWGGSPVGTPGAADGERTGSETGPNNYVLREAAGLGIIAGTLWDDTASADTSVTPDGAGLPGQQVTLTWAGVDGDFATATDNRTYTTTTDGTGRYQFGVLPSGLFRIDTPAGTITYAQPLGSLHVRIDTDGSSPLAQIVVTLGEGVAATADAGYVQINDAPVNTVPGTQNGAEDTPLAIGGITVADVDAGTGVVQVTLGVLHGTLSLSAPPAGVTVAGDQSANLSLTGTLDAINAALATLVYLGNQDFNGADTLTVITNDHGHSGDAGTLNGTPNEDPADALTDTDSFQIVLAPVNDTPVANNDVADAREAGGQANGTVGLDPRGSVLDNDTDVDIATNGDALRVVSLRSEINGPILLPNPGAGSLAGRYGTLTLNATGGYVYTVDNNNAAVQALRLSGQTLVETFTYTIFDGANASATATLTVTIHGANDNPVGVNDAGTALEAGGVANGTPGTAATGNVLPNDTDVDSTANGESHTVTGVRTIIAAQAGPVIPVAPNTSSGTGAVVIGQYGTLTIGADGSYRYVVDDANATVQRMHAGDSLIETFSYVVTDAGGLNGIAELTITIQGSNDNPVANDDTGSASPASTDGVTPESHATGNVVTTGPGADSDVDAADQPNSQLHVDGIRTGTELAGGTLTAVAANTTATTGTVVIGLYGTLTIGADGSYDYDVDSTNATLRNLPPGATVTETFTYRITDTAGLTDIAQLVITVSGVNDPPVAQNDTAQAIEAGGVGNGTAGVDPAGSVLANDADPDGDAMTVTAVRTGTEAGSGTAGTLGQALTGIYGALVLNADGTYRYIVNNDNPAVQALRTDTDTLSETFTYTIASSGGTDVAQITIVIHGRNDNPVAVDDTGTAIEAGGTLNGNPGQNATGNVLTTPPGADTDVDASDTATVTAIRTGTETAGGTLTAFTGSTTVTGTYGTLTLQANGTFVYAVDNSLAAVQALRPGQSVSETFTYQMADAAGGTDLAQIIVTVNGAWDAPVATDDRALAAAGNGNGPPFNPTGNVLPNDTDVDAGDVLAVTGIVSENLSPGGGLAPVAAGSTSATGSIVVGQYGTLFIGADGSYRYVVDVTNPVLVNLPRLGSVTEVFTYQATDLGGLSATAQLTITVFGRNDAPVPVDDFGIAIEASGVNNTVSGTSPDGNVLQNDVDPDSNTLSVTGIRTGTRDSNNPDENVGRIGDVLQGRYGTLVLLPGGGWKYVLDNDNPVVNGLRTGDQTLQEVFTYTSVDTLGAAALGELHITIIGRNDTPVAQDDAAIAIEAGGVANGTPGVNPEGDVLANDRDVDFTILGETRAVVTFGTETGAEAAAGQVLAGRYGTLTLRADGSYTYVIDNDNPDVQALRTADEVLSETFTYVMQDTAGATSVARLTVRIQGSNDNPVAQDDAVTASDQIPAPQASGNVLPNDSDIDAADQLTVVGVRTGAETGTGTAGTVGQSLAGLYGTLVLNADGSYTYTIDQSNPDVLRAAGMGLVLHDTFTYTVADRAGATDLAQLVVNLDIATPYIPPPDYGDFWHDDRGGYDQLGRSFLPEINPAVFVTPEVQRVSNVSRITQANFDEGLLGLVEDAEIGVDRRIPVVPGQFVHREVRDSQLVSAYDRTSVRSRHGVVNLSADGLLSEPSVQTVDPAKLIHVPAAAESATPPDAAPARPAPAKPPAPAPRAAADFQSQLHAAAARLHPFQPRPAPASHADNHPGGE